MENFELFKEVWTNADAHWAGRLCPRLSEGELNIFGIFLLRWFVFWGGKNVEGGLSGRKEKGQRWTDGLHFSNPSRNKDKGQNLLGKLWL